jgi:hypothetical protein
MKIKNSLLLALSSSFKHFAKKLTDSTNQIPEDPHPHICHCAYKNQKTPKSMISENLCLTPVNLFEERFHSGNLVLAPVFASWTPRIILKESQNQPIFTQTRDFGAELGTNHIHTKFSPFIEPNEVPAKGGLIYHCIQEAFISQAVFEGNKRGSFDVITPCQNVKAVRSGNFSKQNLGLDKKPNRLY